MDPLIGSTLISVGGSLLGGLFGGRSARKAAAQQRAWALEDQKMQWIRHREASEAGGFNPLATLGMGQGVAPTPVSSNNYMGEAIAQSALILGENLAKTSAANKGREVEDLRRQRDILTRKLTNQTIRPTVPGVYQRAQAFGTGGGYGQSLGSGNGPGVPPAPSAGGFRPLETATYVDPRRAVDNKPITSSSGFMEVDNPYLPKPLRVPTLDGDEPLQWYDYPSMVVPGMIMAAEIGFDRYKASQPWAPNGGKPGRLIPESEMRKPFPRKGSESAFNYHMGRHRPYPAWARPQ